MEQRVLSAKGSRPKIGTALQVVEVVVATLGLLATVVFAVWDPSEWFSHKPDVRYEVLPAYTLPDMSVVGVQLFNEGRGVAERLSLEMKSAGGTTVREVEFTGDLLAQLAGTGCGVAVSSTVTCSIPLMLDDAQGAIYVLLDSPDELVVRGVWGNPPVQMKQVEHGGSLEPTVRVLRALLIFLGFSTVFRVVLRVLWICFGKPGKKEVPG